MENPALSIAATTKMQQQNPLLLKNKFLPLSG